MQFFTRIIAQMLHGPLGEKLSSAKWMQDLAQNTHKAMEKGGKMAAEQKVMWDSSRDAIRTNAHQMKSEINNSYASQYYKGIKEELSQLKSQIKEEDPPKLNK